jgi:hypothetical protein
MDSSRRTVLGYIVVGLVGLVIGYFAGREHLKYEMRSAFQSAVVEMQKGLTSAFGVKPGSSNGKTREETPPPKPKEPEPISVTLIKKGFRGHDWQSGIYQDTITFGVSFKNLTGKDIRAFDGVLTFSDLLGNTILSSHLAINDPIGAGATMEWNGQMDYNQFMDSHQRLRSEKQSNLKITFNARKLLFADGTTKEFE